MKLHTEVEKALNNQISVELHSAYTYLGMSAFFEHSSYPGFSSWMRLQGNEELEHAKKFVQYIFNRNGTLVLNEIPKPVIQYKGPIEAFEASLAQEQAVSESIINIYELAAKHKDYPTQSFLKWFLDEQVEEENIVQDLIGQLKLVGSTPVGLFQMDREAARRSQAGK
ncbi:MAG: ferritin [Bdellovibrionota bacterium]